MARKMSGVDVMLLLEGMEESIKRIASERDVDYGEILLQDVLIVSD
jgi:hypothetical protein